MRGETKVPDGWQVVRLGDVATLQRGVDLPVQDRADGPIPVYGSNGILDTHSQTPHSGPGVITGRSGSIGEVFFSAGPYWPLNTTLYVNNFHGNSELFIYYLLSHLRLERFAASTGVPSLNRNFVHPEPVAVPPLHEQRAIAAVLDSIDEAIERTEAIIDATERLRDALLHELLTRGVPGWHTEWKDVRGIGTIPTDWEVVRLRDVAEVAMGQSPPGANCNRMGNGIPLLNGPTEFGRNHPTATQWTIDPKKRAYSGELLFCVRGATAGRMNWADREYAIGRGIASLRHHAGTEYRYFLHALVEYRLPWLLTTVTGSTFPNLSYDQISGLKVAASTLVEQRAIAAVLNGVDDAIERAREERDKFGSLKTSASDALLTGRLRARFEEESQIEDTLVF